MSLQLPCLHARGGPSPPRGAVLCSLPAGSSQPRPPILRAGEAHCRARTQSYSTHGTLRSVPYSSVTPAVPLHLAVQFSSLTRSRWHGPRERSPTTTRSCPAAADIEHRRPHFVDELLRGPVQFRRQPTSHPEQSAASQIAGSYMGPRRCT